MIVLCVYYVLMINYVRIKIVHFLSLLNTFILFIHSIRCSIHARCRTDVKVTGSNKL